MSRVAVLGGGSFGRALAIQVARSGRVVTLWSRQPRDPAHANVRSTTRIAEVGQAELVFVAAPSIHIDGLAQEVGHYLDGTHLLVHVSRGLIGSDLTTLTQRLRSSTPCRRVGVLAGPLVARALAEGEPGGAIVGSLFPEVTEAVREAIGGPTMRIYGTSDVCLLYTSVDARVDDRCVERPARGRAGRQAIGGRVPQLGHGIGPPRPRHRPAQHLDGLAHADARGGVGCQRHEARVGRSRPAEHAVGRLGLVRVPEGRRDVGRRGRRQALGPQGDLVPAQA